MGIAHATAATAWTALAARVAQSQGVDLYSLGDNLLQRGAEYLAKFNLNGTVEYDPKWYRCEAVLIDGPWQNISYHNFGLRAGIWDISYYEYVVKRGIDSPWLTKAKNSIHEYNTTSDDLPSWGDLLWAPCESK